MFADLSPICCAARRRHAGLTLMELLLASAVTSLIALCIAMMVKGTSDGTKGQTDGRRHLVRMQAIEAALVSNVRPCWCILAAGNNYLVLWRGDGMNRYTAPNLAVNLTELMLLECDTNARQLKLYATVWPPGYPQGSSDVQYAGNTNWYNAAQSAKSSGYFPAQVLANNVTGMNVTLGAATPTQSQVATVSITLDDGKVARTMVVTAALRTRLVPR